MGIYFCDRGPEPSETFGDDLLQNWSKLSNDTQVNVKNLLIELSPEFLSSQFSSDRRHFVLELLLDLSLQLKWYETIVLLEKYYHTFRSELSQLDKGLFSFKLRELQSLHRG